MMKKKIMIVLLLSFVLVSLTACGRAKTNTDQWPRITRQKKIIVGLDDTFVPMGFRAKNGQIEGFDIDLAKAVFKLYDIQVDFQAIDWSMKEMELQNQTIDLIWNGYSVTPEREKEVAFSAPYLENNQVLVSLKKNNISEFAQMKGLSLGVQNGSSGYAVFLSQPNRLKKYIKEQTPILYDGFNEAFIDLKAGRIQGLLIDQVYATYFLSHEAHLSQFNIIKGGFPKESFAVGLRKPDQQLKLKLDQGFSRLEKNGTLAQLQKKWFGQTTPKIK